MCEMQKVATAAGTQGRYAEFGEAMQALVRQSKLTRQAFLDELVGRSGQSIPLGRFNGWLRGAVKPPVDPVAESLLLHGRAIVTETSRYPDPPHDVPATQVQEVLKSWQFKLTLKQISVITGIPFITLRSWEMGRHHFVRYSKWQQAVMLMTAWQEQAESGLIQEAAKVYHRKSRTVVVPDLLPPSVQGPTKVFPSTLSRRRD